jgi:hypothetical protein
VTNSRYGETVGTAWRNASAASCALWLEKNVSALITSPPARRWTKFEKTTSKPFSVSRTL